MNYGSYTFYDDKYQPTRQPLHSIQPCYLSPRLTFVDPWSKVKHTEPTASTTSLNSYRTFSPLKTQPAPNVLDTVKRLLQVAIEQQWTKRNMEGHWEQFKAAFGHYDSKGELDSFFKAVTVKVKERRCKSQLRKKFDFDSNIEKNKKKVALYRHVSCNISKQEPLIKKTVRSKSVNFKVAPTQKQNPSNTRHIKMLNLCESIESAFDKYYRP